MASENAAPVIAAVHYASTASSRYSNTKRVLLWVDTNWARTPATALNVPCMCRRYDRPWLAAIASRAVAMPLGNASVHHEQHGDPYGTFGAHILHKTDVSGD